MCGYAYTSPSTWLGSCGRSPGGVSHTCGSSRCGAERATAANFDENSPMTRCVLRRSTRPNTAASQKRVEPPLPISTSYPSGSANRSARPSRTRPYDRPDAFLAVARAEEARRGVGERGNRFVRHLRRTGAEPSVARPQVGGDLERRRLLRCALRPGAHRLTIASAARHTPLGFRPRSPPPRLRTGGDPEARSVRRSRAGDRGPEVAAAIKTGGDPEARSVRRSRAGDRGPEVAAAIKKAGTGSRCRGR